MYVLNECLPAHSLFKLNIYEKTLLKVVSLHLRFFWHLLRPNRRCESLNIRKNPEIGDISFENNDLSMFKHSSKAHCDSNNRPIWTQKVPKEA